MKDAQAMKIALYKHIRYGFVGPQVFDSDKYLSDTQEYVRVSEWTDIEFSMLPPAETVELQLRAIDAQERALRLELGEKLADLDRRRGELRALTHDVAA